MSINADLSELLQQLPDLLSWVVPGLLFMFVLRRFKYEERSNEKDSISILKAISISFFIRYMVIAFSLRFPTKWFLNLGENVRNAICSCVFAFILGILFGCGSKLTFVKIFSEKHLHFTIDSNPYYDLADKEKGCYVRVYLKDDKEKYVYGVYSNCYNRGNEDWIVVKNAIRIKIGLDIDTDDTESQYNPKKAKATKLLINTKEVELIEYVYASASPK